MRIFYHLVLEFHFSLFCACVGAKIEGLKDLRSPEASWVNAFHILCSTFASKHLKQRNRENICVGAKIDGNP